jgi:hypothetical protein
MVNIRIVYILSKPLPQIKGVHAIHLAKFKSLNQGTHATIANVVVKTTTLVKP